MSSSKPKTESVKKITERLLKWLQYFFNTGAVVALILIALVVLYQIVTRVLPLKSPLWTDEVSRYLFIYCVIFASCAVVTSGRHIKLELFQEKLPERGRIIYSIVINLIIAIFCLMLIQHAWNFTLQGENKTLTSLTSVKKSWVSFSTVIFFILVPITCFLMIIRDLMDFIQKGREKK